MSKKKPSKSQMASADKKKAVPHPDAADLFAQPLPATDVQEMVTYGIKRVPVDYYHYGDFRYTNLADAIAQAKRGCATLSAVPSSA